MLHTIQGRTPKKDNTNYGAKCCTHGYASYFFKPIWRHTWYLTFLVLYLWTLTGKI